MTMKQGGISKGCEMFDHALRLMLCAVCRPQSSRSCGLEGSESDSASILFSPYPCPSLPVRGRMLRLKVGTARGFVGLISMH
jgi:hypothetical protein